MLEGSDVFDKAPLPAKIGDVRLEALAMPGLLSVAPFKGQMMAVADSLRPLIGITLPPAGVLARSDTARAFWYRPGQWLVAGDPMLLEKTSDALAEMAATATLSGGFGTLALRGGGALPVLSRLCALDLDALKTGMVAQTVLADIAVVLIALEGGFELLVPRSYAGSVVKRLKVAMRSTAALGLL